MKPPGISWKIYLRNGLGQRFSRLGQRIGSEWLSYNPWVMRQFHDGAVGNAPKVVNAFNEVFPGLKRVFDVGAGSGAFAAEFRNRGCAVLACEHSAYGRKLARMQGVESLAFDLAQVPPCAVQGEFDVVYCFEIAEHLTPDLGANLVRFLSKFRAPVVFTAAQPGQGGTGHINEQPISYWREKFQNANRLVDEEKTKRLRDCFSAQKCASWFERNALVLFPGV
jgi:SAM-dependent methyltransferase